MSRLTLLPRMLLSLAGLCAAGAAYGFDLGAGVRTGEDLARLVAPLTATLALLALGGLIWQWSLARRAEVALQLAEAESERAWAMLEAAPDGFFLWHHSQGAGEALGEARCSRRLAVLLGLYGGVESGWAEVLAAFTSEDAARLERAAERLREEALAFTLELALDEGGRSILVRGLVGPEDDGRAPCALIWMGDAPTRDEMAAEEEQEQGVELARLHAMLDAIPLPIWMRDDDLSLVYCNRTYAFAVDSPSPEQAVIDGIELAAGPEAREARALAARARAASAPRAAHFHLVLSGQRRLSELWESPVALPESEGGLMTAGCAVDLSRQEELEDEVVRHVRAHADVLERLATAIAIFGADTRLAFYNTAYLRLWRLEREWLDQGPTYGDLLDALRERRLLPEMADFRAFRDEELKRFTSLIAPVEDVLHLPDNSTLRRVMAPHPFGGLLVTAEDVTDKLALQRSYNTSIAVQRETIDHLFEAVAVFGANGRLRLWNPSFGKIWALSAEDLGEEPHFADLIARQPALARLRPLFEDRRPDHGRMAGPQGGQLGDGVLVGGAVLEFAGVPLPDGAVLVIWLDVSDSAKVERALRERNDALAEADQLKSEFIANVSDEVCRPLDSLISFADVLAGEFYGPLNKRQKEYMGNIAEAGRSLQALVADILDLARIEAGRMSLALNTLDIHALLSSVLTLTRERVREKQLALHFDCPPDIGWMVGDERRLRQILFNLLSNAVKFTPTSGQVTLAAQREGEDILFTVADTGIGIAEAEQEHVFANFARLPSASQAASPAPSEAESDEEPVEEKKASEGAGLGLPLVRHFVEMHGGKVEIVSVPGEGTTIFCRIPAGMEQAVEAQE